MIMKDSYFPPSCSNCTLSCCTDCPLVDSSGLRVDSHSISVIFK